MPTAPDEVEKTQYLLSVIDAEIQRLLNETTRHGRSNWIVTGAIGTLLWLIGDTLVALPNRSPSWMHVRLILTASLLYDFLASFRFLSFREAPRPEGYFFISSELYGGPDRLRNLLRLFRSLGLACAAVWLTFVWKPTMILATVFYSWVALASTRHFALSFISLPMAHGYRLPMAKYFTRTLVFVGLPAASASVAIWLDWKGNAVSINDVRFAATIVAIYYLMMHTHIDESPTYTLQLLYGIRRDLALGVISAGSAETKLTQLLLGFRMPEAFNGLLSTYEQMIQRIQSTAAQALQGSGRTFFGRLWARAFPRSQGYHLSLVQAKALRGYLLRQLPSHLPDREERRELIERISSRLAAAEAQVADVDRLRRTGSKHSGP